MFCTACGYEMKAGDRFCASCGRGEPEQGAAREQTQRPPMMRAMMDKKIAGVCAGIARHFGWDVTLVRIAFLLAIFVHGFGLLAYVVGWIAMPRDDERMVVAG
jgi:phage shock protein C